MPFSTRFPCNVFNDNLYYSVMLELEADKARLVKTWHKKDEYLFSNDGLLIKSVYIFMNVPIQ